MKPMLFALVLLIACSASVEAKTTHRHRVKKVPAIPLQWYKIKGRHAQPIPWETPPEK